MDSPFVAYDNESPWPTEPDGQGPSLELTDPLLDNAGPENWRASAAVTGTPGEANHVQIGIESGAGPSPLAGLVLEQNVPNPFNPETALSFSLSRPAPVTIRVLSPAGRVVRQLLRHKWCGVGRHAVTFDGLSDTGGELASGVYLVELELHGDAQQRRLIKMTLLR